jgi:5-methylthioadenosine/S-adenosylhomocysteine deaminase
MSASLIRSRAMVTHAIDRHHWNEVTNGAVLQEDGTIVEVGTYQELSRKHPNVAVVGSGNEVMLPISTSRLQRGGNWSGMRRPR